MIIKKVKLDNQTRKGEYWYVKEGDNPPRYFKANKSKQDILNYYNFRYEEKDKFKEGKDIFNKYKKGKKLNKEESVKLSKFITSQNVNIKISKNQFNKDYKKLTGSSPISTRSKLRDDLGKPIKLRNNKYKIITKERNEFFPSQYVGIYRIRFKHGKNIISANITGYSNLNASLYLDEDLIKKQARENALNHFYNRIGKRNEIYGYNLIKEGDGRIREFTLIKEFWVSYLSYEQVINARLSKN